MTINNCLKLKIKAYSWNQIVNISYCTQRVKSIILVHLILPVPPKFDLIWASSFINMVLIISIPNKFVIHSVNKHLYMGNAIAQILLIGIITISLLIIKLSIRNFVQTLPHVFNRRESDSIWINLYRHSIVHIAYRNVQQWTITLSLRPWRKYEYRTTFFPEKISYSF